jgi:hypothetical protein
MKVKVKKKTDFDEQIKEMGIRMKSIIKELDHIKQSNQILTSQIQEMLDKSNLK